MAATLSVLIDSIRLLVNETVVGNLFDDVAFGAINLVEPYMILVEFFSYLICVGGTAMLVRARGAKKPEEMQRLFNHCVTCCLILGLFFFAVFSLFNEWFVSLVTQNSAAHPYTLEAFFWERFYLLLLPLYVFMFTYVLYFDGALVNSVTMVLMTIVDTGLSVYLGRKMGIGGVTCATFIAHCLSVVILSSFVIAKHKGFPYRPYVNPDYIKELTPLGLPESCFLLALVILEAGINALALKRYSIQGVAVAAVVINLYEIVAYVSEGISEYETLAVNWALGDRNREEVRYGMRVTLRAVLIESLVFSLLFLFAAPLIVEAFDIDSAETAKTAVLAIRILALSPLAIITARVTAIFHQYTEKLRQAALIWICCIGLIPLLLAAVLGSVSLEGLIWGIALGPVIPTALMWIFPLKRKKAAAIDLVRTTVIFSDESSDHSSVAIR
jgi:Na+-driven multidrug efflux pump